MFEGGKITQWRQGDYEISIRQMDPFRSMKVLGDLQKILLPVIGGAVEGLKDSSDNAEMIAAIGGALGQIAGNVDGDKLEKACDLLLDTDYLAVKGENDKQFSAVDKNDLAAIYTGRPWDLLALCAKIFEVNFLDFSTSSSVPIGIQKAVNDIRQMISGGVGTISAK
jgi:outer membrane lipoprotein SlyB